MKATTKQQRRKLIAMSAVVGTLIMVGATAAIGAGVYSVVSGQIDPFTESSSIEVRNLNAVRDDDTLRVTATLKNSGQTSITSIFIESISVSEVEIKQDQEGKLTLESDAGNPKTFCHNTAANNTCDNKLAADEARGVSLHISGTGDAAVVSDSVLEGGRTNAIVLEIECNDDGATGCGADISDDINISDKLNLVLRFYSGDDELLTDVSTTRVKPG